MDQVRLTYFAVMGRAEVTRRLLLLAGVEFEDIHLQNREVFARHLKAETPFGQLPVLEIEGQQLCQSLALNRYIATKYGLGGNSLLEDAMCDDICYTINDSREPYRWIIWENDEKKKDPIRRKYEEEQLPMWLRYLEDKLISNKGGDGYFVGDSMTYADVMFTVFLHPRGYKNMCNIDLDLTPYPKLAALVKRVESHPIIAERIKQIPDSWRM